MLLDSNSTRRGLKWAVRPLLYRLAFGVPFYVSDAVLRPFEDHFAVSCPWCGRQYFSKRGAKACCAETKARRGPDPYYDIVLNAGCGGGYGAGSARYDYYSDRYIDRNTGKTYSPDHRY